jgi:hypothetical protein
MPETWPNPEADYEFPGGDNDKERLWTQAIKGALAGGSLTLHPDGDDLYTLRGECPRCSHQMSQVVDFRILVPRRFRFGGGTTPSSLTLDVVCSCTSAHHGRGDGASGCGWGRGLRVPLDRPATGA